MTTGRVNFASAVFTTGPEKNPVLRLARKLYPITNDFVGQHFFVLQQGKRMLTPLALVLLMVETTDLIFAIDSIPAIFAVTTKPFIVFTSNVFAILGLRSLYFLLAGAIHYFKGTKKVAVRITHWKGNHREVICYAMNGEVTFTFEDVRLDYTVFTEVVSFHENGAANRIHVSSNPGASLYYYETNYTFDEENHPLKKLLPKPDVADVKYVLRMLPKEDLDELMAEVEKKRKKLLDPANKIQLFNVRDATKKRKPNLKWVPGDKEGEGKWV